MSACTCSSEVDRVNRFSSLHVEDSSLDDDGEDDDSVDVDCVRSTLGKSARKKRLRVATWNFSGLCSKQKEVGEYLAKNDIDVVAGQESWEKEDSRINVDGYKWFEKPRSSQTSQRGEGGVGFLVRESLVSEVEFISQVKFDESLLFKLRGERGRGALFVGCVYMTTDSASVSFLEECYSKLKEDVLSFREKGKVVLLGDLMLGLAKLLIEMM